MSRTFSCLAILFLIFPAGELCAQADPDRRQLQEMFDLSAKRKRVLLELDYIDKRLATLERSMSAAWERVADPIGVDYSEIISDTILHSRATKDFSSNELLVYYGPGIYRVKGNSPNELKTEGECWYFRPQRNVFAGEQFSVQVLYEARDLGAVSKSKLGRSTETPYKTVVEIPRRASRWSRRSPTTVTTAPTETATVLDDASIQFSLPSPANSEVTLRFAFEKPVTVKRVRLEILPDSRFDDRRIGRQPGKKLMLFDVIPQLYGLEREPTNKVAWSKCWSENQPEVDETMNCMDALSDTGYELRPLKKGEAAHEIVFEFAKPISISAAESLAFTIDSGGSPELDTIARLRLSFD